MDADVQEYINLMNQVIDQTYAAQRGRAEQSIKEHFAARGLSQSGLIQQGLQDFGKQFADAIVTAKLKATATGWGLQAQRNTMREQQRWEEKWMEKEKGEEAAWADQIKTEQALSGGEPEWVTRAKQREGKFWSSPERSTIGQRRAQPYDTQSQGDFNKALNPYGTGTGRSARTSTRTFGGGSPSVRALPSSAWNTPPQVSSTVGRARSMAQTARRLF